MSFDRAELICEIRTELGCASIVDLSDKAIEIAIDAALLAYSKAIPVLEDIELTVPPITGLLDAANDVLTIVSDTWTNREIPELTGLSILGPPYAEAFGISYAEGYGYGNIRNMAFGQNLNMIEMTHAQHAFPATVLLRGGKYEFLPAPEKPRTVWLRVGKKQTDATFPDRDLDILREGAVARAMRTLALRRYKYTSIKIGSESLNLRDPNPMIQEADKMWRKFLNTLGPLRSVRIVDG